MVSAKGKEKVDDKGKGKRKINIDEDKTGSKRKKRGVLQFFDDEAYDEDEDDWSSDDSLFDDDSLEDEFETDLNGKNEPRKVAHLLPIPKEEEMTEEEFERMMEERYKPGSNLVRYAEDGYELKRSVHGEAYVPSAKDPTIWKVKCMVGRERYSAFCLMQKYVDLINLGSKLQIISVLAPEHIKGFIFIEAEKQCDINEACKGLCTIYSSRVSPVPLNELSHLLSIRSKSNGISEGMWARVKSGKYKGDLAQVVAVNDARKKVTVKLVPRIDLHAMAAKFGGGIPAKRAAVPVPRLISSSELEEFRPLIQYRRDRETNMMFEVLDGMLLKDGYFFKRISIDSLSFWGVTPTKEELLKFEPSKNDETKDVEWLNELFGQKKKRPAQSIKNDKGGGKEAASSSYSMEFEVPELVFFGRKDFGVVIGTEKDDNVKVIKEGSEGPLVVSVKQSELKSASFDKKLFTALDQRSRTISINDLVRVCDGPLKDRQGIVKKIYRGILFLFDENEQENNGYTCVKAQLCEKVNLSGDVPSGKGSEPEPSGFEDVTASPKSPLFTEKPWQERDNKINREDNGLFSVGQSLRIKMGPLKGYLCRVIAVRRSDVTVKLDSLHKILTVKCENLSEVRGRSSAISQGEDSASAKPFDFLGSQDGSTDWMGGGTLSTGGGTWNAGGSTARSSWPAFSSSTLSLHPESGSADPSNPMDETNKEGSAWEIKTTSNPTSSWGAPVADTNPPSSWGAAVADEVKAAENGTVSGWGNSSGWKQAASSTAIGSGSSDVWGKAAEKGSIGDDASGSKAAWNQLGASSEKRVGGWGNAGGSFGKTEVGTWKKDAGQVNTSGASPWKDSAAVVVASSQVNAEAGGWKNDSQTEVWATKKANEDGSGWGKNDKGQTDNWDNLMRASADGGSSLNKQDSKSSLGKEEGTYSGSKEDGGSSWSKQDKGSSWNKSDGGDSSGNQGGGSWNTQDGGSSWNKKSDEFSWNKPSGGASWGQKPDVDADDSKGRSDQNDGWKSSQGRGGGRGFGGWRNGDSENSDNADQEGSCGGPKSFDGGHGSGGRRGRGGRGRDQYGRGRSFQGQSNSWNKEGQHNHESNDEISVPNRSSWSSGQAGSWGKAVSIDGGSKDGGWDKSNTSGEKSETGWSKGWSASKETGDGAKPSWNNKSTDWGKPPKRDQSSSWNAVEEAGATTIGQSSWEKGKTSDEKGKSCWNSGSASSDMNPSSDWSKKVNLESGPSNDSAAWNKMSIDNEKDDQGKDQSGGWNAKKNTDGSSSTGWAQGNWSKSGTDDTGANQGSTWSSKSNWNEGNGFGGTDDQDDGGRRESWKGGRGGRGDRGGFRGRGGSDHGGFRGRGSGRGGFGGRGAQDGYGGGFRGRGNFRGRGSGDWNNSSSSGDYKSDWSKGSNRDGEEWKSGGSGGSWSQVGSSQKGQWNSWGSGSSQSIGNGENESNAQAGGWNIGTGSNQDATRNDTGWNQPSKGETGGWNKQAGWNQGSASGNPKTSGHWKSNVTYENQLKEASKAEKPSDSWGKAAGPSWGSASGNAHTSGAWNKAEATDAGASKESTQGDETSDPWGKAAKSCWGN